MTFNTELETIWCNPNTRWLSKLFFVINRYLTEAILIFIGYLFSESATTLNDAVCLQFIWLYGIGCVVFQATSHFILVIRIYRLWDRRNDVARNLTIMFGFFMAAMIVVGVFIVRDLKPIYNALLHTCLLSNKPIAMQALYGVTCAFDLAMVIFIIFNAMDRPRLTNVQMASDLHKDGMGIFMVLFVIRLTNFMVAIFFDISILFISTTTAWALSTIINSRFQMRLEALAFARAAAEQRQIVVLDHLPECDYEY